MVIIRSSWKGSIGFSLLSIPVSMGGAVGGNDIETHQYAPDGSKIKYKRVSEKTGEEVAYKDIQMGYSCPDGNIVFLTDKDFEEAYGTVSRKAEILQFCDASDVPDMAKSKPFFVQPDKGGEKAYAVLVAALRASGKVAIIKFGMRQRKRLGALSPTDDGYLVLEQLEWAEDIRKPDFAAPAHLIKDDELGMATTLINSMSKPFDHASVTDDSQAKLNELINSRIEKGQVTGGYVASKPGADAMDIMAALKASIDQNKATPPVKKPRARKASA